MKRWKYAEDWMLSCAGGCCFAASRLETPSAGLRSLPDLPVVAAAAASRARALVAGSRAAVAGAHLGLQRPCCQHKNKIRYTLYTCIIFRILSYFIFYHISHFIVFTLFTLLYTLYMHINC